MPTVLHVIDQIPAAAGTTVFCCEVCDRVANRADWKVGLFSANTPEAVSRRGESPVISQLLARPVGWLDVASPMPELSSFAENLRPDVVHIHGIWSRLPHAGIQDAKRRGAKIVVSPHGMLTQWALSHHGLRKRIAWSAYQQRDLAAADVFHATSPDEVNDLRRLGFSQPVAVVPLGVEVPEKNRPNDSPKRVLFVSRIHPKKGLINLVDAWRQIVRPGWELVIAGPDEGGFAAKVQQRIDDARLSASVRLVGPVFGDAKTRLYQSASVFVLPSFSENFGVVILEALACGVPVITTRATPWGELETHRCGWWVDIGVKPLALALEQALALEDSLLAEMGQRGRELVRARYSWDRVADGMTGVYRWLKCGGVPPDVFSESC